jgi:hypothetical protein
MCSWSAIPGLIAPWPTLNQRWNYHNPLQFSVSPNPNWTQQCINSIVVRTVMTGLVSVSKQLRSHRNALRVHGSFATYPSSQPKSRRKERARDAEQTKTVGLAWARVATNKWMRQPAREQEKQPRSLWTLLRHAFVEPLTESITRGVISPTR